MRNFELFNPIRMIFGAGEFSRLGEVAKEYGSRPLVVVGRSHAQEAGLLNRAIDLLMEAGMEPVVFEGIEPNPRISTCQAGARMALENKCDMIIGIGGGSVMDASKAIAFGVYDPDGMWLRIAHWLPDHKPVENALPIILASTLAATGSEGDSGAVISNDETREKAGVMDKHLFPKASIIDPELTLTTPIEYTRDGAVDMLIHVLEGYFNGDEESTFSDRCTEGFAVEVMAALETVIEDPGDIEARSQLSYLGAIALQGFINHPRGGAFPMHAIEHALSAYYDISHGRGLALIFPRWLRFISRSNPDKIIQFGDRVFGMALETHHPFEAADKVIDRIDEWLEDIGSWFFMEDLGIPNDPDVFCEMAKSTLRIYGRDEVLDSVKPMTIHDIISLYKNCVRLGVPVTESCPPCAEEEESDEECEGKEVIEEVVEEIIYVDETAPPTPEEK